MYDCFFTISCNVQTVTAKYLVNYIVSAVAIKCRLENRPISTSASDVESLILKSNPILEAFGRKCNSVLCIGVPKCFLHQGMPAQ